MHDNDAASLNRMLLSRMEELCQFLLPNGKPKGHHWMVGGLSGEAGESLQITMSGSAAGRFIDFANPENKGASPLWLFAKVKGLTYPESISAAKEWLGVRDEDFGVKRQKQKTYVKPEKSGIRLLESNTPVMDYLVVARQLDPIVVSKAKVCETPDGEAICFPFIEKDPETGLDVGVHRKFLRLERPDGKKDSWTTKGTKRCLYGKNLIEDNVSELVICEGEIDALSWHSWSIPAVSVPNGVADFEWVDIDWEWLERFEKIYVSMDMDEPGKACSLEIAKRLGIHRCYIVEIPKKDANECLQARITREGMLACLSTSKALELDEIKRPDDFKKDVLDHYTTDPALMGYETPWWPSLPWRVRKGELTVFSGFSGSGKALSLDTRIPTPTGWKTMREIFPGDQVFDQDGNPCNVVFATPEQLNRKCYEVRFSDGSTVVADADHLWETWSPNARNSHSRAWSRPRSGSRSNDQRYKMLQPEVVNTEAIKSSLKHTQWSDSSHHKHAIPVAGTLSISDKPLPIDPYCLGAWLGDGDSEGYGFTCGRGDEETLERFVEAGFGVTEYSVGPDKCPRYGISGMRHILNSMGLINNKSIPEEFLWSSQNQRLELLRGLMDTDGYIDANGRCEFTSMSSDLANGVRHLVVSLGMKATSITGEATVNGKNCGTKYRIGFTPNIHVFHLSRKSARVRTCFFQRLNYRYIIDVVEVDSVPVKCIQVDSDRHLYLCGESMIPTHNTQGLNQLMLHLVQQGLKVMDASLEIRPGLTLYYMTRCAMGKKNATKEEAEACINWLGESMYFLDCIGMVSVDRLMHAMEYARKRHGIDVFTIDSLFKCGLNSEDYNAQKQFADRLTTFCNNTGATVFLVAHARKTSNGNEFSVPTKADVAGSSDLTNAAFNVLIWWRNKKKKRDMDIMRQTNNYEELSQVEDQPDGKILLDKQRFGEGEECETFVWFDKDSCQFSCEPKRTVTYFKVKP